MALGVGVILVTGSFYVSASNETIEGDVSVVAKPPTRNFIEPKDTDGDGVNDWAEELLADREIITQDIDTAEAYVPPSTLTERFSIKFFQDYLYSKGFETFEESKDELAEQAIENLKNEAQDIIYNIDDIVLDTDDSTEAIRRYGNRIAEITIEYTDSGVGKYDEMSILQQAMDTNNPDRLADLDPIINTYQQYFEQTKATPVPPSLVRQHIDLINVYNAILGDLLAMRTMFEDPLLGLLRVKRYNDDVSGLIYVYYNIDRVLRREGITYDQDEPGAMFEGLGTLREIVQQR